MKQVLQNLGSGETLLAEVPQPGGRSGCLLIETQASLVSIGTEKMLIDFGKSSWLDKARKQPDKVKQVLAKIKTDGLFPTIEAVRAKLDQPIALGYANVGLVLEDGGCSGFRIGDQVVSNGPHAEVVCVPKNLCAKVPDGVSDEAAAFTVVGAIGLQGIRLLQPTLGETVVVTGLGLIGLLAVQLLRAQGCRVLGVDFDSSKCALARSFGAEAVDLSKGEDPVAVAMAFSRGRGVDAVLITASTQSHEPVHQAALMCRKRGRIVLVGVVGLQLSRADFYEKELSFQVSCSYGPGRYDEAYEVGGQDYPVGFVRWTEQRNFEAILDMMASGRLDVGPLISHRFRLEEALKAYETVGSGKALGIVLGYGSTDFPAKHAKGVDKVSTDFADSHRLGGGHLPAKHAKGEGKFPTNLQESAPIGEGGLSAESLGGRGLGEGRSVRLKGDGDAGAKVRVGVIGAGNFTGLVLLPGLAATGARLRSIASAQGVTGTHLGKKFGFELSTTDAGSVIGDESVNLVMVTTRHNSHGRYVLEGLKAGKAVYVEKPLCLTRGELKQIAGFFPANHAKGERVPFLMVGFNRRFAPQVVRMRELMGAVREPKSLIMTVNAGAIPAEHWTQSIEVGGGRIVGEGCHFVDLLRFLVGSRIVRVQAMKMGSRGSGLVDDDKVVMTFGFEDGSVGSVHYLANGHKSFPKERLEVFAAGRVLQLDNFRKLTGHGWPRFSKMNLWNQDKGHRAEMAALVNAVAAGAASPIPFHEIEEVTRVTFDVMDQLK